MSTPAKLGNKVFFEKENFLEHAFCRKLCNEINNSLQIQSPLPEFKTGVPVQSSTATRPKIVNELKSDTEQYIRAKLVELMPEISAYFQFELTELRDVHFAIYEKGNFVARHVDAVESEQFEESIYFRKVTVVVFLNDEDEEPSNDCYGGGQLTIYGVYQDKVFKDFGVPILGLTGKLVAFDSTAHHEVTPVEHGTRLIISTGFN